MDSLSCLPDDVICLILSFIPTKSSVQTSVLSKRWRFLWADVPLLGFYLDDTSTVNVITNILFQHKHDIHTFDLTIREVDGGIGEEFQSWIENITTRNIHNLFIRMEHSQEHYQSWLPQSLFACKTLVDLRLYYCRDIPTTAIYLPVLRKLKLHNVLYESHESLSHLISGCPVLDELNIEGIIHGYCNVSSPTLTRLVLKLYYNEGSSITVKLDTPALRYLWLCCSVSDIISVGALDLLIEADINPYWSWKHQDNLNYSRFVSSLVSKLYNVQLLRLSTPRMQAIHDCSISTLAVDFHNLTKLNLCLVYDLGFINFFIENASNLQVLKLNISDMVDIVHGWMEPKQVPGCLVSHLQTVDLWAFGYSEHEFDIVRYILMNAKVLKNMKVRTQFCEGNWEKKFKALKRLAMFERGSQECQLVFD